MTKEYFLQIAEYNVWANDIAQGWLQKILEEQWLQPIVSSFGNLEATALHIAGAESVWLDRLNKVPEPVWLPSTFKGGRKDVLEIWGKASHGLKTFIEKMEENQLNNNISFRRINGDLHEMKYYQVLSHVFNHSTFHRGQVVTILRQVGFTDVSSTDILGYFRK